MTTLTIKNIPPEIYERLKERAKANRRSLNNEIIVILERETRMRVQPSKEDLLEGIRKVRELTADYVLTDDEINKAKHSMLNEPSSIAETALLSEQALGQDWERPEEDEAWVHLQPGK